ncbi:hypothetical protein N0V88_003261 [Collariella sp. IMI 366227]|nr:hypothetical protein N0V88_003261 [Collariella sp. IMI 366227]
MWPLRTGTRVNRGYVVSLQKKVRQLEDVLAKFTDQEEDDAPKHDDVALPGGIVRLSETDELPRYLGPSSGTAMTRLVMEEGKKFAETGRIANLIPNVLVKRAEHRDRMQSVVMGASISGPSGRKKSYPAHSIIPATKMPSRDIVDRLVRTFNDRVQVFSPILHEKTFDEDVKAVMAGDTDPYRYFIVNIVIAISLQKVGKYAGLPDSYFLSAMRRFEDVVRPQDLRTLQCLALIAQYSLLTPTRTAVYYVVGLATRICQQMGLADEATIGLGVLDPLTLDMRRRLSWVVTDQEFSLAHIMGRPNGFAKTDDLMNVKFFDTAPDENITSKGIHPGPPSERKLITIHFLKMRLLQAEIRRVVYEKKRQATSESDPWFSDMDQRLRNWLDSCPEQPECMIILLYRPSPQVPSPTSNAALRCFEAACSIIDLTCRQIQQGTADITWESLLTVYAALNALLWSISYPEVRTEHPKDGVEDVAATALEAIRIFSDRWPGSSSAVELYTGIATACLQSYDGEDGGSTPGIVTPISPESDASAATPRPTNAQPPASLFNPSSPFGYVFDPTAPGATAPQFGYDDGSPFQNQPTFRSNSIFMNPSSDSNGRRLSHLAPDFAPGEAGAPERAGHTPPPLGMPKRDRSSAITSLPTPPEALAPPALPMSMSGSGQGQNLGFGLGLNLNLATAEDQPQAAAVFGALGQGDSRDGFVADEGDGYYLESFGAGPGRHGSLSQEQQMELMDVLEAEVAE